MGFIVEKHNFRVEVTPNENLWILSRERETREKEIKSQCDTIAKEIRRHVDEIDSVTVLFDTEKCCEHCGADWSEASPNYNGGCCDKDEQNNPNPEPT